MILTRQMLHLVFNVLYCFLSNLINFFVSNLIICKDKEYVISLHIILVFLHLIFLLSAVVVYVAENLRHFHIATSKLAFHYCVFVSFQSSSDTFNFRVVDISIESKKVLRLFIKYLSIGDTVWDLCTETIHWNSFV
jgi:hypothetical protein